MRIAWIGLGAMGRPMALAALRAGHALQGYARRPDEQSELSDEGAVVSADLLKTVEGVDAAFVTLFSETQVREVVVAGGVLAALPAGSVLVLHSTVSPAFAVELAGLRPDISVVDAGFSGGPDEAANAGLTLMVGGEPEVIQRLQPVLAAYAGHIARLGPVGSGMTLKVINNLTFAANVAMARDALRLVQAQGLDVVAAVETLGRGSAGSAALRILGSGGQPEAVVAGIRHYLEKDVAIARRGAEGMSIGALDAATAEFVV